MDSAASSQKSSAGPSLTPTKTSAGRAEVQAKTFTKWINAHLRHCNSSITDLFTDLRDGVRLLQLTEVLTGETLRREKGSMRVHHLANLNRALDYLRMRKNIKLVNIDAGDLADGSEKLTLGLIWMLIQHFHIAASADQVGGDQWADAKSALLEWCRQCVSGYENVTVSNFSDSWRNGRAFSAVVHRFRPDLVDFSALRTTSSPDSSEAALADLRAVFAVAEQKLGVEALLEAEDVNVPSPEDRSIMMYVAMLRNVLGDIPDGDEDSPDGSTSERASEEARDRSSLVSEVHSMYRAPQTPLIPVAEEQDVNGEGEDEAGVMELQSGNVERQPLLASRPKPSDGAADVPDRPAWWQDYLPVRTFCIGLALLVIPIAIEVVRRKSWQ